MFVSHLYDLIFILAKLVKIFVKNPAFHHQPLNDIVTQFNAAKEEMRIYNYYPWLPKSNI